MRPRLLDLALVLTGGALYAAAFPPYGQDVAAWIETSTAPKLTATDGQSYGYLWWLGGSRLNGHENRWVGALGRGGQSIRLVPEHDLVVAVTAGYYEDYSPKAFQLQYSIFRDVLRAIPSPA